MLNKVNRTTSSIDYFDSKSLGGDNSIQNLQILGDNLISICGNGTITINTNLKINNLLPPQIHIDYVKWNSNGSGHDSYNSIIYKMEEANRRIEEWVKRGDNTKILNLNYLELTELPESLFELTNLEYLVLENNNLTTLPESIDQLSFLKGFQRVLS